VSLTFCDINKAERIHTWILKLGITILSSSSEMPDGGLADVSSCYRDDTKRSVRHIAVLLFIQPTI